MIKKYSIFLYSLSAIFIFFVLYFSRSIFFFVYEPEYYENLYYHSQWNYPNSTRGISDGEIYKFVGYRLVQGENPFDLNYEIPPFGKYLYGVFEVIFGNPFYLTTLLYFASIILLYYLNGKLFKNNRIFSLIILLFVTTPFVATQIRTTMLDLPLMFFYLLHVYFFVGFLSKHSIKYLAISGIFLGIASGIKPPIYTPVVFFCGALLILFGKVKFHVSRETIKHFHIRKILTFLSNYLSDRLKLLFEKLSIVCAYGVSIIVGYVFSYFQYFVRHPNPMPWIRLHEKPLRFYLSPESSSNYLNIWKAIFLNKYEGWWGAGTERLGDWTLLLPVGVISAVIVILYSFKGKNKSWLYISLVTFSFLLVNTFIPFFPRYLMPIIPLLTLLIVKVFKKAPYIVVVLAILNVPFLAESIIPKEPVGDAQSVARFISTRANRELYRSMPNEQREQISEDEFIKSQERFIQDLKVRNVEVELGDGDKVGDEYIYPVKISYVTEYGKLINQTELEFVSVHNQWRLVWKWKYVWPNYDITSSIEVNEGTMPIKSIVENGKVIATRNSWYTVYVIPRVMFDWNKHLNSLSDITSLTSMEVDGRIRRFIPDHYPRFVGYLDTFITSDFDLVAESIPGVSLKDTIYLVPVAGVDRKRVSEIINSVHINNSELFSLEAEAFIINEQEKFSLPFERAHKTDVVIYLD